MSAPPTPPASSTARVALLFALIPVLTALVHVLQTLAERF